MALPTIKKRPVEEFSLGLKYVAPDLEPNGTIDSVVTIVEPDEAGGVKRVGAPTIDGDVVSQVVNGGNDGVDYTLKFRVTTSEGHIYEDAIFVQVRDIT